MTILADRYPGTRTLSSARNQDPLILRACGASVEATQTLSSQVCFSTLRRRMFVGWSLMYYSLIGPWKARALHVVEKASHTRLADMVNEILPIWSPLVLLRRRECRLSPPSKLSSSWPQP